MPKKAKKSPSKKPKKEEIKQEKIERGEHGKIFFSWQFPEFPEYKRGKGWYIGAGIVVLIFLVYAILSFNFLFASIVILTILILIIIRRRSLIINFSITEDGIILGSKFYDYKDIEKFWIIYEPPEVKNLYFQLKGIFNPRLPINLTDQNPIKVREVLLQFLQEDLDQENEPFSDQLSRFLKL